MKTSRQQQMTSRGKPDDVAATPAGDSAPKRGATGQPCFARQTNSCKHGADCHYNHVKIPTEDYLQRKRKREEALAMKKSNGMGMGKQG